MVAKQWLLVIGMSLVGMGCTRRVYFSQSLRDGLRGRASATTVEAEASLQFFAAHRIVLERDAKSRAQNINSGRIFVRRGRLIEQVVIRRGTPGVATGWGEDWISVSFEEGTSLVFERADGGTEGNALYRLRKSQDEHGATVIEFADAPWSLASPHYNATLQVKRNAAGTRKKRRRVLEGRTL